ncbi:MAG TPA: SBBP repeat-containing protein [Candidatus Dormibacteraeota bacterium]|nr:SBBP repeat-containing protein [Candidatus Dormibacteraeota bacterium]
MLLERIKDKLTQLALRFSSALIFCAFSPAAHGTSGSPLWTNFFKGPTASADVASALAVDLQGNVFVTGSSDFVEWATVKYSGAGVPLWTNRYRAGDLTGETPAIAVDSNGNVFVTGSYSTVAYANTGVPLWTNFFNGSASAVAVDSNGHVFVTGASYSYAGGFATVAYSSAGVRLWTNYYSGGNGVDEPLAIAVDRSGNVFVTGNSANFLALIDYATVAYSAMGVPLWTNRCNVGNLVQQNPAMAVDASGNVFVTGTSYSLMGDNYRSYYATVAYSNSGVPLWTNLWGNGFEVASSVAVDNDGHVFVTGISFSDFATLAYSSAGASLWTNSYQSAVGPVGIAVDNGGNVFIAGSSANDRDYLGYATVAYSGAGVPIWTNLVGEPRYASGAQSVAVDRSGNVFVTGTSFSEETFFDIATIKYSSSLPTAVIHVSPLANFSGDTNLLVIAAKNTNACVKLDGSASSDPDNSPLTYQWFNDLASVPFATGAAATDCLGLGPHNIRLIVANSRDATRSDTVRIEIISACGAAGIAEDEIERSNLPSNRKHPLLVALEAACQSFERGLPKPAINELEAFEHKVQAQVRGPDPALAGQLTAIAEAILTALRAP